MGADKIADSNAQPIARPSAASIVDIPAFVVARKSEIQADFGTMVSESETGYIRLDPWSRVTFANPAALHMLDVDDAAILGLHLTETSVAADIVDFVQTQIDTVLLTKKNGVAIFQQHRANGLRQFEIRASAISQRGVLKSIFIQMINVLQVPHPTQDIAERREMETAAEVNARQFRAYFSDSPLGMMVRDDNFKIRRVNAAYEAMTGYSVSELVGEDIRKLIHPDDLAIVNNVAAQFASSDKPVCNELRILSKAGDVVWIRGTVNIIKDASGVRTLVSTAENITARVASEAAAIESNRRLRALIDSIPEVAWMKDVDGRYVAVNQRFTDRFGVSKAETIGRLDRELFSLEVAARFEQSDAKVRNSGKSQIFELVVREENGIHWHETTKAPVLDGAGNCIGVVGIGRDVTESRRQGEAMARLLREHEVLFAMTSVGIAHMKQRIVLYCNLKAEEIFGYAPGEMRGLDAITLYRSKEEYDQVGIVLRDATGPLRQVRHQMKRKDGSFVWCAVQSNSIDPANPLAGYISTITDVTELKAREDALQAVLREQRVIFDNALVGITLMRDGRWLRVNDAFCRMFGYTHDEFVGANNGMLFPSVGDFQLYQADVQSDIGVSGTSLRECQFKHKDGSLKWCLIQGSPVDRNDISAGLIFAIIDISNRKASEEHLVQTSKLLDAVLENLPTVVAVRDVKTRRYLRINRAGEVMMGRGREDVIGKTPDDIYPSEVAEELFALDAAVIQSRQIIETETSVSNFADGTTKLIVRKTVPVVNQANEVEYVMSLAEDVTQRVKSEQALRESETRFRQFAANINQVIFLSDPARTSFEYLNDRAEDVWGVSIVELRRDAKNAERMIVEDDLPLVAKIRMQEEALQPVDMEIRIRHPEKGLRWIRVQTFPKKSDIGGIRVFGLIDDITDRKDEEQLRIDQLMEQRDVLVREVHHRIKNNLQGVAGLLQHASRNRPELKKYLDEVSTQIQAIAKVHGLQVRVGQALQLRSLARAIFDNLSRIMPLAVAFGAEGDAIDGFALPESEAVPVALVLNELGTNALKHGTDGARVRIFSSGVNVVVVEVENRGLLPAGFDYSRFNSHASGIGLIKALVPRRGGAIEYQQLGEQVMVRLTLQAPAIVWTEI